MGDIQEDTKWRELYVLTEHWKSDLLFYKDDLRFLHHLLDKYVIWITKEENLELVKGLQKSLHELKLVVESLLEQIAEHQKNLGLLVTLANMYKEKEANQTHAQLEERFATFVKDFRENRKELFRLSDYIIDSEEMANIFND
ncbi:MAG: hypothetical protein HKO09_00675 [Croceitalea sp.]|nr:hypothetical protein [Croceitalea sp.]